jgi:hypothetical protein
MKAEAKRACSEEIKRNRDAWVEDRVVAGICNVPAEHHDSERIRLHDLYQRAVIDKRLMGDFVLISAKHGAVTVKTILENPGKFNGDRFADPLEPDYSNDPRIAVANLRSPGRPYIYSHAHGGQRYALLRNLQTIKLDGGELVNNVRDVLGLLRLDGTVFERGGEMVRMANGRIYPATPGWLTVHLSGLARFEKFDGRSKAYQAINCPMSLSNSTCEMVGDWGLPQLSGHATAPTITTEGRIIDADGHDAKTGIYLDFPDSSQWDQIPDNPCDAELKRAVDSLWHPFKDFPFIGDADRGAMFSAILTATVRQQLPTAPGFLITAPAAGSGKTLLAVCLAILSGQNPEILPHVKDDDEMRKRLLSVVRSGAKTIILDNLSGTVNSDTLCAFLTSSRLSDRILGESNMLSVNTNCMVLLTGNNPSITGDLNRRLVRVRLDPECEKPFDRKFTLNPQTYVEQNRLKMVRAALTVLRGMFCAELPAVADGMGSFDAWSDFIRKTVLWVKSKNWLSIGDPAETVTSSYEVDTETQKLSVLLYSWHSLFGNAGGTVADAIREAKKDPEGHVFSAIDDVAGEKGYLNPRRLGRWIEAHEKRIVADMRFMRSGFRSRAVVWMVVNGKWSRQKPRCFSCEMFRESKITPSGIGVCVGNPPDGKPSKRPEDGVSCNNFVPIGGAQ